MSGERTRDDADATGAAGPPAPGGEAAAAAADPFAATGHPVHARSLEIEVFHQGAGRVSARGRVLDLRKFGFVPTGGDLQTAGVIHDMSLEAEVDARSRVLRRLEPAQNVVAFEASPRTDGESCRDSIHRLRALAGARLDRGFAKRLSAAYGGALGCSHLLTLAHLLATTVPRALDWEAEARAARPGQREPGERLFKRCLVLDGFERDDGAAMDVAMQLGDFASHPFATVDGPLDRFSRQHEVRLAARIDMADMRMAALDVRERARRGVPLTPDGWVRRDALVAPLLGGSAVQGLARRVREHLGDDPAEDAVRDTLLNFAPGVIQCLAAFAHRMVEGAVGGAAEGRAGSPGERGAAALGEGPAILQVGGLPDSCYIWREGGPGLRARAHARASFDEGRRRED